MTHPFPTRRSSDLSNTILRYLGNTRGESLYPPQPARRSEVDCWMDWQLGTLNNGITPLFQSIVRTPVDQRQPEVVEQHRAATARWMRSEEHTSELQSLMRNSYAVFCLKKKKMIICVSSMYYTPTSPQQTALTTQHVTYD